MTSIPNTGRIHPLVFSSAVRQDEDFVKNHLSAHFRMSRKTVVVICVSIILLLFLLALFS